MRLHDDDELPDDHAALMELAADVTVAGNGVLPPALTPPQRSLIISDEATALVGDPLVGFATHGR